MSRRDLVSFWEFLFVFGGLIVVFFIGFVALFFVVDGLRSLIADAVQNACG